MFTGRNLLGLCVNWDIEYSLFFEISSGLKVELNVITAELVIDLNALQAIVV